MIRWCLCCSARNTLLALLACRGLNEPSPTSQLAGRRKKKHSQIAQHNKQNQQNNPSPRAPGRHHHTKKEIFLFFFFSFLLCIDASLIINARLFLTYRIFRSS
ncbi:hypothetical protein L873DRAFT_1159038 [Choiromyces venosus 120613-1]|uniref:Secreted protein n=1 Tax=Choiromyces venosus 120613-1 TaxID=1336337 RepID=A0A3N4JFB7_9PEZI|nr:hypothetical protein L873DRAFT_1159038 [Choiromyces venosus 120613-1]